MRYTIVDYFRKTLCRENRTMSPVKSQIKLKTEMRHIIDNESAALKELALKIHSNPELGYQEFKAAKWLTEYLENHGFAIEKGVCGIQTSFVATYGKGKPRGAILAEYDALPGIGHGCGHNLICTIACGAAVAAKRAVDEHGGTILVIGTPAEETAGAKVEMAKKGIFNGIDAALIAHPGSADHATMNTLAMQGVDVEFFGRASHASANPEMGINALDAMVLSINNINAMRQHLPKSVRIHGIITDGGRAANIIPDHSAGEFMVRATNDTYLNELKEKVIECFKGAACATGARLVYRWQRQYSAMKTNNTLAELYIANMNALGRNVIFPPPDGPMASTDMGNVSQIVPAIHPMIAIGAVDGPAHSPAFAKAAASPAGLKGMLDAAKALAMTAADILGNPAVLKKMKDEFNAN